MSPNAPLPDLAQLTEHQSFLASLARSLVGDGPDADDLAQEVWLEALSKPRVIESPRAWLATVTRRLRGRELLRGERRDAREREVAREEALPSSESIALRLEASQRLTDAVRRLDEPFRSTVHLHYAEGASAREIARRAALPVETVRSRIKRGLELLRRDLDADFAGDRSSWCAALAPLHTLPSIKTAQGGGLLVMHWKLVASVSALALAAGLWSQQAQNALAPLEVEALAPASNRTSLGGTALPAGVQNDAQPASNRELRPQEPPRVATPLLGTASQTREELKLSGRLVGSVMLEGELPKLEALDFEALSRSGVCMPHPQMDTTNRELRFDAEGHLQDVVLELFIRGGRSAPTEPVTKVQVVRSRFEPYIALVPKGGRLSYEVKDAENYVIHGFPKRNPGFNYTVGAGSWSREFLLSEKETFQVKDDLRPWMSSHVYVHESRFVTISDARGEFVFEGLPEGRHELRAWHPLLGKLKVKQRAEISNDETTSLPIVVPEKSLEKAKKALRRK